MRCVGWVVTVLRTKAFLSLDRSVREGGVQHPLKFAARFGLGSAAVPLGDGSLADAEVRGELALAHPQCCSKPKGFAARPDLDVDHPGFLPPCAV